MINNETLSEISGGSKIGIAGAITAIITFIVGIFDGYQRPLSCNR